MHYGWVPDCLIFLCSIIHMLGNGDQESKMLAEHSVTTKIDFILFRAY